MIGPDVLHVFHLGVARDICGSVLRLLVAERYWPGSNIDARLAYATGSLKRWCKQHKLHLAIKRLSKQNLSWSEHLGVPSFVSFFSCSTATCL